MLFRFSTSYSDILTLKCFRLSPTSSLQLISAVFCNLFTGCCFLPLLNAKTRLSVHEVCTYLWFFDIKNIFLNPAVNRVPAISYWKWAVHRSWVIYFILLNRQVCIATIKLLYFPFFSADMGNMCWKLNKTQIGFVLFVAESAIVVYADKQKAGLPLAYSIGR